MFEDLDKGVLEGYQSETKTIVHEGISYEILNGCTTQLSRHPIASVGTDVLGREIIILDPNNSPILNQKFQEFQGNTITDACQFIRAQVFDLDRCDERHIDQSEQFMPLDAFVEAKIGVCRHWALVTGYFLDRLFPQAQVYHVRDTLKNGGHAWNLMILNDQAWHIDAFWNVIKNLNNLDDLNFLYSIYGRAPIDNEIKRFLVGFRRDSYDAVYEKESPAP